MTPARALLTGVALTVAVLGEVTVVARLPWGAGGPQLVVLVVAIVALRHGPRAAMATGFVGGVLADLAPPALHPVGRSALALVLVGHLVGAGRAQALGSPPRAVALVGVATAAAVAVVAVLDAVLTARSAVLADVAVPAAASGAWTAALAWAAVPAIRRRGVAAGHVAWEAR